MVNIINNTYITVRETCLPEILTISQRSSGFPTIYKKIKEWLLSLKDFIECPSFCEGENTDTSRFDMKIQMINMINNK